MTKQELDQRIKEMTEARNDLVSEIILNFQLGLEVNGLNLRLQNLDLMLEANWKARAKKR